MEVFADEKSATVITTVSRNPRDEDGHTDRHFCLLEVGWSSGWWKPKGVGGKELEDDKDFVQLLPPFKSARDIVDPRKRGVVCPAGTFTIGIYDTRSWRTATSVRVTPILVRNGVATKAEEASQTIELKGLTSVLGSLMTPIGVKSIVFVTDKAKTDSVTVLVRVEVNAAFEKGPREPSSDVAGEEATLDIVIIKLIPFEVQAGTFFGEHPPKAVRKRNPNLGGAVEEDDEDIREMSVDLPKEFEIGNLNPGKRYLVTAAVKLAHSNQWSAENEATGEGNTLPSDEPAEAGILGQVAENVQKQVVQIATFCKDDQNQKKIVAALPYMATMFTAAMPLLPASVACPLGYAAFGLRVATNWRDEVDSGKPLDAEAYRKIAVKSFQAGREKPTLAGAGIAAYNIVSAVGEATGAFDVEATGRKIKAAATKEAFELAAGRAGYERDDPVVKFLGPLLSDDDAQALAKALCELCDGEHFGKLTGALRGIAPDWVRTDTTVVVFLPDPCKEAGAVTVRQHRYQELAKAIQHMNKVALGPKGCQETWDALKVKEVFRTSLSALCTDEDPRVVENESVQMIYTVDKGIETYELCSTAVEVSFYLLSSVSDAGDLLSVLDALLYVLVDIKTSTVTLSKIDMSKEEDDTRDSGGDADDIAKDHWAKVLGHYGGLIHKSVDPLTAIAEGLARFADLPEEAAKRMTESYPTCGEAIGTQETPSPGQKAVCKMLDGLSNQKIWKKKSLKLAKKYAEYVPELGVVVVVLAKNVACLTEVQQTITAARKIAADCGTQLALSDKIGILSCDSLLELAESTKQLWTSVQGFAENLCENKKGLAKFLALMAETGVGEQSICSMYDCAEKCLHVVGQSSAALALVLKHTNDPAKSAADELIICASAMKEIYWTCTELEQKANSQDKNVLMDAVGDLFDHTLQVIQPHLLNALNSMATAGKRLQADTDRSTGDLKGKHEEIQFLRDAVTETKTFECALHCAEKAKDLLTAAQNLLRSCQPHTKTAVGELATCASKMEDAHRKLTEFASAAITLNPLNEHFSAGDKETLIAAFTGASDVTGVMSKHFVETLKCMVGIGEELKANTNSRVLTVVDTAAICSAVGGSVLLLLLHDTTLKWILAKYDELEQLAQTYDDIPRRASTLYDLGRAIRRDFVENDGVQSIANYASSLAAGIIATTTSFSLLVAAAEVLLGASSGQGNFDVIATSEYMRKVGDSSEMTILPLALPFCFAFFASSLAGLAANHFACCLLRGTRCTGESPWKKIVFCLCMAGAGYTLGDFATRFSPLVEFAATACVTALGVVLFVYGLLGLNATVVKTIDVAKTILQVGCCRMRSGALARCWLRTAAFVVWCTLHVACARH